MTLPNPVMVPLALAVALAVVPGAEVVYPPPPPQPVAMVATATIASQLEVSLFMFVSFFLSEMALAHWAVRCTSGQARDHATSVAIASELKAKFSYATNCFRKARPR
jgi:hypothetical protein